jgi:hypothetical protein
MVLHLNCLTYIISQIYAYYLYKKVYVFLFILYINMEHRSEKKNVYLQNHQSTNLLNRNIRILKYHATCQADLGCLAFRSLAIYVDGSFLIRRPTLDTDQSHHPFPNFLALCLVMMNWEFVRGVQSFDIVRFF